jgi:hypothetical protein
MEGILLAIVLVGLFPFVVPKQVQMQRRNTGVLRCAQDDGEKT